jgi:protein-S-isoprenylcysteine O-methyltransferase Ste14
LPDLQTPLGWLRLFSPPVLLSALILAFFHLEDRTGGFWLLDGEVVILTLGFLNMSRFFRLRDRLLERYGAAAYPIAVKRYFAPGLAVIASMIARMRSIPGPAIPRFSWYPLLPALGWVLIVLGVLLWLRAVQTLGLDTLTMSYVYFPGDGELAQRAIYGMIRHPVYAAAQWLGYGLALLNGTWFALVLALIFSLAVWGWITLVEERELARRFGVAYADYRKATPAFLPRPSRMAEFLRFLLTGA